MIDQGRENGFAGTRPLWTRPGLLASIVLMVLVVVAGVLVAVLPRGDAERPGSGSVGASGSSATQPTGPLPTEIPKSPPIDVSWQLVGSNPAPVSASAGPRQTTEMTATGYARTPVGALIAGWQSIVRCYRGDNPRAAEACMIQQMVPNADRDRFLASYREANKAASSDPFVNRWIGYRYVSYAPEKAVITFVLEGELGELLTTIQWYEGDWRLVAPPGGDIGNSIRVGATDYVKWGPP